jgi:iron-sulfur cluster repair protein YtfE (RIC family)
MIQIGASSATLDAPVDHLLACHRRIEQRLDTLLAAADHLRSNRQDALDAIRKSLHFLDSNGAMHTADEEDSLFPRLRPKLSGEEVAFVDALEEQHEAAEALYSELRQLVSRIASETEVPSDLTEQYRDCASRLRALYREHIASEDQILTPMARRSLTPGDLAEMTVEMRHRRAL